MGILLLEIKYSTLWWSATKYPPSPSVPAELDREERQKSNREKNHVSDKDGLISQGKSKKQNKKTTDAKSLTTTHKQMDRQMPSQPPSNDYF